MKKSYYSIIIITTIISIFLMKYYGGEHKINDTYKINAVENNNDHLTEKEEVKQQDNNMVKPTETDTASNTTQSESNPIKNSSEETSSVQKSVTTPTDSVQNTTCCDQEDQNDYSSNTTVEETQSVFKVDKNDILHDMSFLDKEKVLIIAAKLSKSDYNRISYLLKNDKNGQGVISSFQLLREKLSKKDYSRLRTIASKYINMDVVESN